MPRKHETILELQAMRAYTGIFLICYVRDCLHRGLFIIDFFT